MTNICLVQGNISEATSYFKKTVQTYEFVWENELELYRRKISGNTATISSSWYCYGKINLIIITSLL